MKEEFPSEPAEADEQAGGGESDWGTLELPHPTETEQSSADEESGETAEKPSEAEYEDDKPDGRLQKILRGFGARADRNRKRALNEPKAYARYEDYVPEKTGSEDTADTPGDTKEQTGAAEETEAETKAQSEEYDPAADDEILYAGDFPTFGQWSLN